jgi:hypothetical protein
VVLVVAVVVDTCEIEFSVVALFVLDMAAIVAVSIVKVIIDAAVCVDPEAKAALVAVGVDAAVPLAVRFVAGFAKIGVPSDKPACYCK